MEVEGKQQPWHQGRKHLRLQEVEGEGHINDRGPSEFPLSLPQVGKCSDAALTKCCKQSEIVCLRCHPRPDGFDHELITIFFNFTKKYFGNSRDGQAPACPM